jgi:hypothetical protein
MTYVYSRQSLEKLFDATFQGEWRSLKGALFTISQERAEKACLELALFVRMWDEDKKISKHLDQTTLSDFGRVIFKNKSEKPLSLREVANKIIHSSGLEWDFTDMGLLTLNEIKLGQVSGFGPLLICHGSEQEKWVMAKVNMLSVAAAIGCLVS